MLGELGSSVGRPAGPGSRCRLLDFGGHLLVGTVRSERKMEGALFRVGEPLGQCAMGDTPSCRGRATIHGRAKQRMGEPQILTVELEQTGVDRLLEQLLTAREDRE
jgi:hypothetical protein